MKNGVGTELGGERSPVPSSGSSQPQKTPPANGTGLNAPNGVRNDATNASDGSCGIRYETITLSPLVRKRNMRSKGSYVKPDTKSSMTTCVSSIAVEERGSKRRDIVSFKPLW